MKSVNRSRCHSSMEARVLLQPLCQNIPAQRSEVICLSKHRPLTGTRRHRKEHHQRQQPGDPRRLMSRTRSPVVKKASDPCAALSADAMSTLQRPVEVCLTLPHSSAETHSTSFHFDLLNYLCHAFIHIHIHIVIFSALILLRPSPKQETLGFAAAGFFSDRVPVLLPKYSAV